MSCRKRNRSHGDFTECIRRFNRPRLSPPRLRTYTTSAVQPSLSQLLQHWRPPRATETRVTRASWSTWSSGATTATTPCVSLVLQILEGPVPVRRRCGDRVQCRARIHGRQGQHEIMGRELRNSRIRLPWCFVSYQYKSLDLTILHIWLYTMSTVLPSLKSGQRVYLLSSRILRRVALSRVRLRKTCAIVETPSTVQRITNTPIINPNRNTTKTAQCTGVGDDPPSPLNVIKKKELRHIRQ